MPMAANRESPQRRRAQPNLGIRGETAMKHIFRYLCGAAVAALTVSVAVRAQDFKVFNHTVQMHGFGSQGFAYTNQNNFLTMNTSHGSPAFTEGAVNLSTSFTDKFRAGAQGYARKIGSLDDGRPQLDWAYGDYKFVNWLGVRAGKVKTAMGLYNDTQDMDFLHLWSLLPQGTYPVDLRTTFIAHTGGDVYGRIPLRKAGKLDYTAYAGLRSFDNREGYYYYSLANGFNIESISGHTEGWDLKWTTAVKGLMLGTSWTNLTVHRAGQWVSGPFKGAGYTIDTIPDRVWAGYGDYTRGKWEFGAEYRSTLDVLAIGSALFGPSAFPYNQSTESWYATASYRVNPKLQVGVYHSNLHIDNPSNPKNTASNHIYDEVGAARYDLNRFWDLKAEGHFMDGYGDIYSAQGFYSQWNPQGLKPKTNMLVLRATMNF
jgi:hypothetical protein